MHYRIEMYSDLWKDWIYFDSKYYKTEKLAQDRVIEYKKHKTGTKLRTTQIIILEQEKKIKKKNKIKIVTEKIL